jgi:hypothetical protein
MPNAQYHCKYRYDKCHGFVEIQRRTKGSICRCLPRRLRLAPSITSPVPVTPAPTPASTTSKAAPPTSKAASTTSKAARRGVALDEGLNLRVYPLCDVGVVNSDCTGRPINIYLFERVRTTELSAIKKRSKSNTEKVTFNIVSPCNFHVSGIRPSHCFLSGQ